MEIQQRTQPRAARLTGLRDSRGRSAMCLTSLSVKTSQTTIFTHSKRTPRVPKRYRLSNDYQQKAAASVHSRPDTDHHREDSVRFFTRRRRVILVFMAPGKMTPRVEASEPRQSKARLRGNGLKCLVRKQQQQQQQLYEMM